MSINVRYIYSASIVITTPDLKILCDPWFTDGIFDGSWHQFPKLENPVAKIGDVDYIYISHIHEDHYDPVFLNEYMQRFGKKKLLIANFPINYLEKKMRSDGFDPQIIEEFKVKDTVLNIVPDDTDSPSDVDSALIVRYKNHCVVNSNDCVYNEDLADRIHTISGDPDILCLSYTGASAFPQTFYTNKEDLIKAAEERKQIYFNRYKKMRAHLNPKKTIPFAGQYILGGSLAALNEHRGVADAFEVTLFDPDAVLLDDGGDANISSSDLVPTRVREAKYSAEQYQARIKEINSNKLDYEKCFKILEKDIPFSKLMRSAQQHALRKSEVEGDYYFCFKTNSGWQVVNANKNKNEVKIMEDVSTLNPRSEILVDHRYLYGLLTGVYHWNNAYVGSMYSTRRVPDLYNREAQNFLNFFAVV